MSLRQYLRRIDARTEVRVVWDGKTIVSSTTAAIRLMDVDQYLEQIVSTISVGQKSELVITLGDICTGYAPHRRT